MMSHDGASAPPPPRRLFRSLREYQVGLRPGLGRGGGWRAEHLPADGDRWCVPAGRPCRRAFRANPTRPWRLTPTMQLRRGKGLPNCSAPRGAGSKRKISNHSIFRSGPPHRRGIHDRLYLRFLPEKARGQGRPRRQAGQMSWLRQGDCGTSPAHQAAAPWRGRCQPARSVNRGAAYPVGCHQAGQPPTRARSQPDRFPGATPGQ